MITPIITQGFGQGSLIPSIGYGQLKQIIIPIGESPYRGGGILTRDAAIEGSLLIEK